jgi:hypothetical protein
LLRPRRVFGGTLKDAAAAAEMAVWPMSELLLLMTGEEAAILSVSCCNFTANFVWVAEGGEDDLIFNVFFFLFFFRGEIRI